VDDDQFGVCPGELLSGIEKIVAVLEEPTKGGVQHDRPAQRQVVAADPQDRLVLDGQDVRLVERVVVPVVLVRSVELEQEFGETGRHGVLVDVCRVVSFRDPFSYRGLA
jgi:hypothetical protein